MRPERVSFDSHPSSFRIRASRCDNLECKCTAVDFQLVEVRTRDQASATPLRISMRVDVTTWQELDAPPRSDELQEVVAEFLRDYPPHERQVLRTWFRDRQRVAARLNQCLADPEDVDSGRLIGFEELLGDLGNAVWTHSLGVYHVEWEGTTYRVKERYCLNPDCECETVRVSFFCPSSRTNSRGQQILEEHFQAALALDGGMRIDKVWHGDRSVAEQVLAAWAQDSRRELKQLRWRYDKMKQIGRRSLDAAPDWDGGEDERPFEPAPLLPPTPPIRRSPDRVGRNEPCPCGSGKKFKKCCGRGSSAED